MPDATRPCSECGNGAKQVYTETIRNMLNPFTNQEVEDEPQYRLCQTQDCEVVYFSDETGQQFETNDVRVPVNFKLGSDERPYPLCYCFGYGKEDIATELDQTGESTVADWITERDQAEECACRWKNPRGGCCLSGIRNAIEEFQ